MCPVSFSLTLSYLPLFPCFLSTSPSLTHKRRLENLIFVLFNFPAVFFSLVSLSLQFLSISVQVLNHCGWFPISWIFRIMSFRRKLWTSAIRGLVYFHDLDSLLGTSHCKIFNQRDMSITSSVTFLYGLLQAMQPRKSWGVNPSDAACIKLELCIQ